MSNDYTFSIGEWVCFGHQPVQILGIGRASKCRIYKIKDGWVPEHELRKTRATLEAVVECLQRRIADLELRLETLERRHIYDIENIMRQG